MHDGEEQNQEADTERVRLNCSHVDGKPYTVLLRELLVIACTSLVSLNNYPPLLT